MFGKNCIEKLLKDFTFDSVLDIGAGGGEHSALFKEAGKEVVSVDLVDRPGYTVGDYVGLNFKDKKFDLIWCCHVLEHQLNANSFLQKITQDTKKGGIIAITVPPAKHNIVGGHYTIWNAGLLIYNLVMAGIDCKKCQVLKYGYNISIIVRNTLIKLPTVNHDLGELGLLADFMPDFMLQNVDGDISAYSWDGVL